MFIISALVFDEFVVFVLRNVQEFGKCASADYSAAQCEKDGAELLRTFQDMYTTRTTRNMTGKKRREWNSGISIPTQFLKEVKCGCNYYYYIKQLYMKM